VAGVTEAEYLSSGLAWRIAATAEALLVAEDKRAEDKRQELEERLERSNRRR
jgi:hypothetical protein